MQIVQAPFGKYAIPARLDCSHFLKVVMVRRDHLKGLGRLLQAHLCLLTTCRWLSNMLLRGAMCWPWLTGWPSISSTLPDYPAAVYGLLYLLSQLQVKSAYLTQAVQVFDAHTLSAMLALQCLSALEPECIRWLHASLPLNACAPPAPSSLGNLF